MGSTVNLTDASGGTRVSYRLDPWGHIKSQTGSSVNRQIFTGHEHDLNTNLIYFGARYYDPDTGRFITQDAYLGETSRPPSLHRYLYAYSNPTVYVDLEGYDSIHIDHRSEDKAVIWYAEANTSSRRDDTRHTIGRFVIDEDGSKKVYLPEERTEAPIMT